MKQLSEVIYTYDGTLDGLLTCVFESYAVQEMPSLIAKPGAVQLSIGVTVRDIATDAGKAERVYEGIKSKLGAQVLEAVYHASLSAEADAEITALRYLRLGFKIGRKLLLDLADETVWRMQSISRAVTRESGRYLEFLRFSELEGGILFAEFEPEPDVLPLVMPHFTDRLNAIPFIIHDKGRQVAGVYDTREWLLIPSAEMKLPDYSGNEREYRDLWKLFYDSIAVRERINPNLQRQLLPKKYRRFITEFNELRND